MPYVTGLSIRKCRHIEALDIEIPSRPEDDGKPVHLILTGPNGSGKTGILEGVTAWLGIVFRPGGGRGAIEVIYKELINHQKKADKYKLEGNAEFAYSFQASVDRQLDGIKTIISKSSIDGLSFKPDDFDPFIENLSTSFLLAFIPTHRAFAPTPVETLPQSRPRTIHAIKAAARQDFASLLAQLRVRAALEFDSGNTAARDAIHRWLNRFQDLLRELHEDPALTLKMDSRTYAHTITRGDGYTHALSELAHGHAAALAVVAEIFVRVYDANPDAVVPEEDPEGLVIIDEVEAHLHLSLQEKLMPWLTRLFPRVQFIVSTHSPVVIASLPDAYVFDLGTRTGHFSAEYQGIPYGTIMKFHFGLSHDYDLETSQQLERLTRLLDAEEPTAHLDEINALDDALSRKSASLAALVWRLRERLESPEAAP